MNTNTCFWTAVTVLATSWAAYEFVIRKPLSPPPPGIEEIGESNEQLQETAHIEGEGEAPEENPNGQQQEIPHDVGLAWDNDDRARRALEEHQARQAQDEHRVNAWKQKGSVGTKKAKSLEKRDRRRAYYEYVRQEADRERERIQIEEDMFGDLMAEEREERQKRIERAHLELEEANRKRREHEEMERKQRNEHRARIKQALETNGIVKLKDDVDIEIADELSNAHVLESGDYAVSLSPKLIDTIASSLKSKGILNFEDIQHELTALY